MATFAQIETANGGKFPGFALLRHLLAATILMHHCRGIVSGVSSADGGAATAGLSLGERIAALPHTMMSVDGLRPVVFALIGSFFALSGFLVAGSAVRTANVRTFLAFRALRIVPALFSEVTLSAVFLGALLTTLPLADYYASWDFWRYFGNIGGFVTMTLPGVFATNPVPGVVNANLWTLKPEFYSSFALAAMMATGVLRDRRVLGAGFLVAGAAILVLTLPGVDLLSTRELDRHFASWFIVWLFVCGVAFYRFADLIPFRADAAVGAALAYYLGMLLRAPDVVSTLFLVYATAAFGALNLKAFAFLDRTDYSYGLYLYGYPIAQTLVWAMMRTGVYAPSAMATLSVMAATLALTLAFAALSWRYVEKPVLGWKRFFVADARKGADAAPRAAAQASKRPLAA